MLKKGFTLIEILVVVVIIIILIVIGVPAYQNYVSSAKCGTYKNQHTQVVDMAKSTYAMCSLNGETYMNVRGSGCRSQPRSGLTAKGIDSTGKCTRTWDCKSQWAGMPVNAGQSSGHFFSHVRAEFNEPNHTGSFVRNDQWQNFLKPNYPERPGITNIREKGKNMHIATYLGPNCSGADFTNSGGSYMLDEIVWP